MGEACWASIRPTSCSTPAAPASRRATSGSSTDVLASGRKVEGARVVFYVNNGNLIGFGSENLPAPGAHAYPRCSISVDAARAAFFAYVDGFQAGGTITSTTAP